jgi:hypothetical protein
VAFLELVREVLELDNPINAVVDSNDPREQLLIRFAFRARTVRPKFEARADLMQQHLAAILSVLVEAGLIEVNRCYDRVEHDLIFFLSDCVVS